MRPNAGQFLHYAVSKMDLNLMVAAYTDPVGPGWNIHVEHPRRNALYYIKKGEGMVKIGETAYYPRPGQIMLVPYGVPNTIATVSDFTYSKFWCCFTASVGCDDFFELVTLPYCLDVPDIDKMDALFSALVRCAGKQKGETSLSGLMEAKSLLYQLLREYFSICGEDAIQSKRSASQYDMESVLDYIRQNLHRELTVEELAGYLHIHPNYFIRLFKEQTGRTPLQYINRLRMETAKNSLVYSEKAIADIAGEIGMSSYYFSKLFKKNYGISPTLFRKMADPYSEKTERITQ